MSAPRAGQERMPFVSVAVRVKPTAPSGDTPGNIVVWAKPAEGDEGQRRICCHRGYLMEEYEFSRVFGPQDSNRRLFEDLQGTAVAASVFNGVNETLFAYGQTGSGKTHTIFGSTRESGLLQHFVTAIFERASQSSGSTVHACCYEILGDTLTDLIRPAALVERGDLRPEDVVCDELFLKTHKCRYQIVQVKNKSTCLELLHEARVNRTAGVSSCNLSSSRSHAVVHLFVQNPAVDLETGGTSDSSSIGALTLVDLAGAEKEHENPSEQGRKCARLLNTSLSSLNRLLRKLQTNSLDESERRQSVLNKCLWEYLRPGCGIALIFCVSPLLKHRAISLSTLAMATDSKLIHSRRKSQFIQLPAAWQAPQGQQVPGSPSTLSRLPEDGSPRARSTARARGRTPDNASTPRGASTPRAQAGRCSVSTPARGGVAAGAGAELLGSTPRARASAASMASTPHAGRAASSASSPMGRSASRPERRLKLGQELPEDMAGGLEVLNTKLRRKLSRTRARSRDRIVQIEQERNQLNTENAMLRRECESLRSLFIRQQQQQIAFWAGPFMEMILPKGGPQADLETADAALGATPVASTVPSAAGGTSTAASSSCSVGSVEADAVKAVASQPPTLGSTASGTALVTLCLHEDKSLPNITTTLSPEEPIGDVESGERSSPVLLDSAGMLSGDVCGAVPRDEGMGAATDSIHNVLQERDYWQRIATQLQKQMVGAQRPQQQQLLHRTRSADSAKCTSGSQPRSEPSTSRQGSSHGSMPWSDSGSESTRSSTEA